MQDFQALRKKTKRTICLILSSTVEMPHVSGMAGSGVFICGFCSYLQCSRKGTDGRGRDLH